MLSDVRESKRQQSSSSAWGEEKEGVGGELRFLCIAKKLLFRGRFLMRAAGRQHSEDIYQVELIPAQRWL